MKNNQFKEYIREKAETRRLNNAFPTGQKFSFRVHHKNHLFTLTALQLQVGELIICPSYYEETVYHVY